MKEIIIDSIRKVLSFLAQEEVAMGIVVFFIVWTIVGGLVGFAKSLTRSDGCNYPNIAAYTNPGYILVCEVFRPRWNDDRQ